MPRDAGMMATLLRTVDRRRDIDAQAQVFLFNALDKILSRDTIVKDGGARRWMIQSIHYGLEIGRRIPAPMAQRVQAARRPQCPAVPGIAQVYGLIFHGDL